MRFLVLWAAGTYVSTARAANTRTKTGNDTANPKKNDSIRRAAKVPHGAFIQTSLAQNNYHARNISRLAPILTPPNGSGKVEG